MRYILLLLTFALPATAALAQDAATETPDANDNSEAQAEPAAPADEEPVDFDDAGLDDQGFADEDDDFDPSEEIPTDQSIDFPADI